MALISQMKLSDWSDKFTDSPPILENQCLQDRSTQPVDNDRGKTDALQANDEIAQREQYTYMGVVLAVWFRSLH